MWSPPVDRLPNEIMLIIFSMAYSGCTNEASRLMRVSRRWSELAQRCHSLWTDIIFDPENLRFTRACLKRSGNELLTISVSENESSEISRPEKQRRFKKFIKRILSHNHHWGSLSIEYPPSSNEGCIAFSLSLRMLPRSLMKGFRSRSLEQIRILSIGGSSLTIPFYDSSFWCTVLGESVSRFPKLRALELDNFIPTFDPLLLNPGIQSLTELNLEFHHIHLGMDILALAIFLQNFPELQRLSMTLNAARPGDDQLPFPLVFPNINFSNLAHLELTVLNTCDDYIKNLFRFVNACEFPRVKKMKIIFDTEVFVRCWAIDLFRNENCFPSLKNLQIGLYITHDGRPQDQVLQAIKIPIAKTPILNKLAIHISTNGGPIELVLWKGLERPGAKFPALRSLILYADWENGPDSSTYVKKWITTVVNKLKAQETWEAFERLRVSLTRSEIYALKRSSESLSASFSDTGEQGRIEKVILSRKEVEEWLKPESN